ncbi:hypothetical protein [Algibacillus agarilyticus]|uniref:hypothetical protein n=1 Tax=Algibacillus agarilyticus TaxID=2234133 RepID=UPI000DCF8349|nr:hypothetical protein [Algibacillus agarilyticus]
MVVKVKTEKQKAKLLEKQLADNPDLLQKNDATVESHVQRQKDEWYLNTILLEGYDVPFKFKRKKLYKTLQGAKVNLIYYPDIDHVAGFEVEVMRIVRIKRS